MKASSESGLCATVMVSGAVTARFYVAVSRIDLTCVARIARMMSRGIAREDFLNGRNENLKNEIAGWAATQPAIFQSV